MSKYIDADALIAKLEDFKDRLHDREFYEGLGYKISGVKDAIDIIKSFPEPQLPTDVEEAAWKSAQEWKDGSIEMFVAPYVQGFKAGAEWEASKYELVYNANVAVPDERGGYWPTDMKLYRKKD